MPAKALRNSKQPLQAGALGLLNPRQSPETDIFTAISPDLVLKHSPRAKRLTLRVDIKTKKINLVIPKNVRLSRAYQFALEHKYWIREQLSVLPQNITYAHGTVIPVLGQDRVIHIDHDATRRTTDIVLHASRIMIHTNKHDVTPRLTRFLKTLARDHMTAMAEQKATRIGKKIHKIDIKDTVSRWGSCSHDGKISLNWRLIFAPLDALDYVVAHEVAHLKYLDHSPSFWQICEDLAQNYSTGKSWMRRHSQGLYKY